MVEKHQAGEGWGGQTESAVLERIRLELSGKEAPAEAPWVAIPRITF